MYGVNIAKTIKAIVTQLVQVTSQISHYALWLLEHQIHKEIHK